MSKPSRGQLYLGLDNHLPAEACGVSGNNINPVGPNQVDIKY